MQQNIPNQHEYRSIYDSLEQKLLNTTKNSLIQLRKANISKQNFKQMIQKFPSDKNKKDIIRKVRNKLDDEQFLKSVQQNSTYRYTYNPNKNTFQQKKQYSFQNLYDYELQFNEKSINKSNKSHNQNQKLNNNSAQITNTPSVSIKLKKKIQFNKINKSQRLKQNKQNNSLKINLLTKKKISFNLFDDNSKKNQQLQLQQKLISLAQQNQKGRKFKYLNVKTQTPRITSYPVQNNEKDKTESNSIFKNPKIFLQKYLNQNYLFQQYKSKQKKTNIQSKIKKLKCQQNEKEKEKEKTQNDQKQIIQKKSSLKSIQVFESSFSNQKNKKNLQQIQLKQKNIENSLQKLSILIGDIKKLGYTHEKVSEWVFEYCQKNNISFKCLLFKKSLNKNQFLLKKKHHCKLQDFQKILRNFKQHFTIISGQQLQEYEQQFEQIIQYIEESLVSRQINQLKRIKNQIQKTKNSIENNFQENQNENINQIFKYINDFKQKKKVQTLSYYQTYKFYDDAKKLQSNYGQIKGMNQWNKNKQENITNIQLHFYRQNTQKDN